MNTNKLEWIGAIVIISLMVFLMAANVINDTRHRKEMSDVKGYYIEVE